MTPYTFEYDGHTIEYGGGTVQTRMEGNRIIEKLLIAYNHVSSNPATDSLYDNYSEYGNSMARSKTDAPWWCHSNMTEEDVKARFELFLQQDEDLFELFLRAARAMRALKKTMTATPPTPTS